MSFFPFAKFKIINLKKKNNEVLINQEETLFFITRYVIIVFIYLFGFFVLMKRKIFTLSIDRFKPSFRES